MRQRHRHAAEGDRRRLGLPQGLRAIAVVERRGGRDRGPGRRRSPLPPPRDPPAPRLRAGRRRPGRQSVRRISARWRGFSRVASRPRSGATRANSSGRRIWHSRRSTMRWLFPALKPSSTCPPRLSARSAARRRVRGGEMCGGRMSGAARPCAASAEAIRSTRNCGKGRIVDMLELAAAAFGEMAAGRHLRGAGPARSGRPRRRGRRAPSSATKRPLSVTPSPRAARRTMISPLTGNRRRRPGGWRRGRRRSAPARPARPRGRGSQTPAQAASNGAMSRRPHRRDDAGQHVAGPGAGEPGRRRWRDRGAPVGRGDDRVGTLVDDHRARPRRGGPRPLDLAAAQLAEQSRKFAVMGGEDRRRPSAGRPFSASRLSASASSTSGLTARQAPH